MKRILIAFLMLTGLTASLFAATASPPTVEVSHGYSKVITHNSSTTNEDVHMIVNIYHKDTLMCSLQKPLETHNMEKLTDDVVENQRKNSGLALVSQERDS